jgi:hypothetical protein
MAYFAKLDDNNIVVDVNVVNNETVGNLAFPESEPVGVAFLTEWSGGYSNWKQTYDGNGILFRKNCAVVGGTYDAALDAFIVPKPFLSWLLNTTTCQWEAPISYPTDGKRYYWNEDTQQWVEITGE